MYIRPFALTRTRVLLPAVLWIGLSAVGTVLGAQASPPFSMPSRGPRPAAPAAPPELPVEARDLRPLTLEVTGQPSPADDPAAGVQRVTRTVDRVHVQVSQTREWLYTRNVLDPRRVSAVMVDHRQRVLVAYEESDLRHALGIRGWLDVLTLGFDVARLDTMEATAESRISGGVTFVRFIARQPADAVAGVWWNQAELLPLDIISRDPKAATAVRLSIRSIEETIDDGLLKPPAARFRTYREMEYADWLEDHGKP